MRRQLQLWWPAVAWMTVIFLFSHQSRLDTGLAYDVLLKKSAHVIEYAVLAVLIQRGLTGSWLLWRPLTAGTAWILATVFAMTDEYHQSFVPGRHASGWDVALDGVGALLGLIVIWALQRRLRRHTNTFKALKK
jgi:VanZ family protein